MAPMESITARVDGAKSPIRFGNMARTRFDLIGTFVVTISFLTCELL